MPKGKETFPLIKHTVGSGFAEGFPVVHNKRRGNKVAIGFWIWADNGFSWDRPSNGLPREAETKGDHYGIEHRRT
jgi:hypothetical protein